MYTMVSKAKILSTNIKGHFHILALNTLYIPTYLYVYQVCFCCWMDLVLKLELIDVEFVFVVAFQQFAYFCEFPFKSYICI